MDDMGQGQGPAPDEDRVVLQEEVSVSREQAHQLDRQAAWAAHNWGWLLGFGIAALVLGIVIASHAFGSLHALIWLSGLFLLFFGIVQLLTTGRGGDRRAHLIGALVAVVGGIVLLVWPGETLRIVAVIAGITVLAWGAFRGYTALRERHSTRGHDLVISALLILLGIVMIAWPGGTLTVVGLLIGVAAIVWGLVTIAGAFHLRALGRRWQEQRERARPRSWSDAA